MLVAVGVDQAAPRRRRVLHAEPEERQAALGGDEDRRAPVKATVSIAGTRLGRISRPSTRPVLAPMLRAASTNSRSRRLSVWARTILDSGAIGDAERRG